MFAGRCGVDWGPRPALATGGVRRYCRRSQRRRCCIMATVSTRLDGQEAGMDRAPANALLPSVSPVGDTALQWGNSAPLALLAFATTTFMLSMVNANWISAGVQPVVFGVALMFGGVTQLIAGL